MYPIALIAGSLACQIYDPVTGAFRLARPMLINSGQFGPLDYVEGRTASLLLNGSVLLAGGENEDAGRFNNAELYDAGSGIFGPAGAMVSRLWN
jgi:hypothetical protein